MGTGVRIPQFRTPFQMIGSTVAEVEQDSDREIDQCTEAVLRTPAGTRIEDPEFGRPDETFAQLPPDPTADIYLTAIEQFEPRARVRGEAAVEDTIKRVLIKPEEQGG